ncbi:hypothetical protein GIB67_015147 [Kingdonia uniflora]|uniref:glutathione transferase n=1 Tax=Kingdonia uniflora TaxID=39325 RepID=A0A7J7LJ13_9MAGN|nr:hypothetical protein GIB67_015147 [Kingdonia uniflora]
MTPKLYGMMFSTATMSVAALYEKEVEFEFVSVNLNKEEHKKHPYLAMNPFDQVTALEVGDLKLFDAAVVKEQETKLGQVLYVYEAWLGQSKYLGGDSFSLADLHHLPNMQYLWGTPTKSVFEARPHVKAWATNIIGHPALAKFVAMEKSV